MQEARVVVKLVMASRKDECQAHQDFMSGLEAFEMASRVAQIRSRPDRSHLMREVVLKLCPQCYGTGAFLPSEFRPNPLR
jgi:hypothetical protein